MEKDLKYLFNKLDKKNQEIRDNIEHIMEVAMNDAVETAVRNTPPNAESGCSPFTLATGSMQQKWETDSVKKPKKDGDDYVCYLRNKAKYAGWVNNGHRMVKHFVPGLKIQDGILVRSETGGIVVGTKTKYVKGYYMADKAKDRFVKSINVQVQNIIDKYK